MSDLEIVYQDAYMVAVNKPAGWLVHRSKIDRRAQFVALQQLRDQVGKHVYPVHRLDKPTSGVLLFGLSSEAANRLMTLFAERKTKKRYVAVVRGYVDNRLLIDYALKDVRDRKTDFRARADPPARDAQTEIRCLAKTELAYPVGRYDTCRYSLVEAYPRTGRQHQIRRHCKHIFHPILGDRKYGDWRHNRFLQEVIGCERMLLHAASVSFLHPFSSAEVQVYASPCSLYLDAVHALFDPAPEL